MVSETELPRRAGMEAGVAQSKPAGCEGLAGRGRSCPQSGGAQWASPGLPGPLHVGWHVPGSTGVAGRLGSRQERTAPLLCSLAPRPQGSELLFSHLTDGKTEAQRGKETC